MVSFSDVSERLFFWRKLPQDRRNLLFDLLADLGVEGLSARMFPRAAARRLDIVLDLDETLIHSSFAAQTHRKFDFAVEITLDTVSSLCYVQKRPYLDLFLAKLGKWANLHIFTASEEIYASQIADYLEKTGCRFRKRFFRSACTIKKGLYIKNIELVTKDMSRVVVIDNNASKYSLYRRNTIGIEQWAGNTRDTSLLDLVPIIDGLRYCSDVRNILSMRAVAEESRWNSKFEFK